MKAKIDNKARVLFWLNRKIKALETKRVDHQAMAARGDSYASRAQAEEALAKEKTEHEVELASLREAARFIEEHAE